MNAKSIGAFIVILALLVAFAYYFSVLNKPSTGIRVIPGSGSQTPPSNTVAPPNTTTGTSTGPPGTSNGTSGSLNCVSSAFSVPITNGNFASGTFEGWNLTGRGFLNTTGAAVPTNIIQANNDGAYYNTPWSNYNGTYFASTYHGGISIVPGNLTSAPFKVVEPYLNFKISSPQSSLLYVEVIYNGTPYSRGYFDTLNANNGRNSISNFTDATLPLLNLLCKNVSVRVVAGVVGSKTTSYDFISVGDFRQSKSSQVTPGTEVNVTVLGSPP